MADPSRRNNWRGVTAAHPCPICQHPDWCSVTADGTLAKCMRIEAGAFKSGEQKDGVRYFLHRLDGTSHAASTAPPPRLPGAGAERAYPDQLHRAYSALLARLHLLPTHREALKKRGLSDEEIDRRGFRSLGVSGRASRAKALRAELGDAVLAVPGFIVKKPTGSGEPYLTIAGAAGLLVPVRDAEGRIVALLSRQDDSSRGGGKYSYLSSAKHGGPGPGAPPHLPLGVAAPALVARLTEGALKADIATALSGLPTVGAAGLAWRPALDALQALGCKTVRLAFDADALDNPHVARALSDCCAAAVSAGLAVELERWPLAEGKGIDDLLATGKAPELLTDEAAAAAIAEALSASTAGEPPPEPDESERLAAVLDADGAAGLFRDKKLLRGLAALSVDDPPEYARKRVFLREAGVKMRDFDRAVRRIITEEIKERPPHPARGETGGFFPAEGCICRAKLTPDGPLTVQLCNFTAAITDETAHDDGAERRVMLGVAGRLAIGRELPHIEVPAESFSGLGWVVPQWGSDAIVWPGEARALPAAIQALSGEKTRRTVYAHTGWRRLGDAWHYLHAGGAIGESGVATGIEVSLPDPLAGFCLPAPPVGEALAAVARESIALFDGLAPDRLMFPLLAAIFRAVLGMAPGSLDFALHLAGPHAVGKSELAALAQQHFGAALDARHLPGGWSSTVNALEGLAFAAKDALIVVDDYAPRGAAGDRQRLERDADRLLRAQGNRAGRQRMRADGSLRPAKPPRGLILSTGEDVPPGQSLRGRMLILEVSPGDVPLTRLNPHQRAAAAGHYAEALAGFLRWLAPQYRELCEVLPARRAELRERALTGNGSARTPGVVADLALGLSLFLDFALAAGALTRQDRDALARRGWAALQAAAAAQAEHVQAVEPTALFLRLLVGALASGRAHVAGPAGLEPKPAPQAWGWRGKEYTFSGPDGPETDISWLAQGKRIGWIDGDDLYLEPEASYAAAQEMARDQGDGLPVQPRTLHRRLHERGLLLTIERHGGKTRYAVRRTLEGRRRDVLHLHPDALSLSPSAPSAPTDPNPRQEVALGGRARPDECAVGALESPECAAASPSRNGHSDGLAHLAHSDAGDSTATAQRTGNCFEAARAVGGTAARPAPDGPSPPAGAPLYYADEASKPCGPADCARWTWEGAPRWYDAAEHPPPGWRLRGGAQAPGAGS
jgi:hypothetical protein